MNKTIDINFIKEMIDKCDTISFDIFDTLLFRNIASPVDIFKLLDKKINEKFGYKDFFTIRIESESKARLDVLNGEANYDEIYDTIANVVDNDDIIKYAKQLELDLEYEFSTCNLFMMEVFKYATNKKKNIFLISDMYLDKNFIEKMLKKAGYNLDSKNIYISNQYRKNKGTGSLYQYVSEERKLSFDKWLHIGDNTHSDYNKPIELGMLAYNYKNVSTYRQVNYNSIAEAIIVGIQNNYLYNGLEIDYWDKFGVLYLSPIYFGFTDWLYKMTVNFDNLFFLARDGYLIEKIYKLFPNINNKFINYIYGSRKTIQIPAMLDDSKDYMINFMTQDNSLESSSVTLGSLFEKSLLGKKDIYLPAIKCYGFNSYDDLITDDNRYLAIKLIANFYDDVRLSLESEREILNKYLKQEGLYDFDHVNVVDVGWAGSIQDSLRNILNKDVRGYYFGTIDTNKKDYLSESFGYYFDLDKPLSNKNSVFSQVMMYEIIFSAPHGSTIGYKKEKDKIVPILDNNKDYNEVVEKFQNASFNIIKEYIKYYDYFDQLDKKFCLNNYINYLERYDYEDMLMFSKISNDFLIGSSISYPYVETIKKENVKDYYRLLLNGKAKSLWQGAYVIEGIDNYQDVKKFLKQNGIRNNKLAIKKTKRRELFRKYVPISVRKKLVKIIRK